MWRSRYPNRLVKAAMTERIADKYNAPVTGHQRLYDTWADTGAGILLTGNVMIDRVHLESAGNVCFDKEDMIPELSKWSQTCSNKGVHPWVQISHAGRQTSRFSTRHPLAPSAVQLKKFGLFGKPRAMTEDDIQQVIIGFANAARIAKLSGFTGVQLHAAHGYLLSEFLSPLTNTRNDRWGGSLENRSRILIEIIRATRESVGVGFPISVKLNSSDFQKGGFGQDEFTGCHTACWRTRVLTCLRSLVEHTSDQNFLLSNARESTRLREAYFIDFAEMVRDISTIPLMVTGGFRSRDFL